MTSPTAPPDGDAHDLVDDDASAPAVEPHGAGGDGGDGGGAGPVAPDSGITPQRKGLLWRLRRGLFLIGLFVIAGLAGVLWVLSQVPLPDEAPDLSEASFICDAAVTEPCNANNAMVALSAGEYRSLVEFDDIPPVLRNAVIAAEDRDFFRHRGIDPIGIGRALWADVRTRSADQGGSTITQQYVKNAYLTPERTLSRKLREAVIAIKLERELGKEEILKRYLNTIYFGRGAYGVQAASETYFSKSVDQLSLDEAAYLAALIRSPENTDASRNPEVATQRRRSVLDAMVSADMITSAEANAADIPWDQTLLVPRAESNDLGRVFTGANGAEYYIDAVRQLLVERYGFEEVFGGGLRVYTSYDPEMQRQAFAAVNSTLNQPDDPDAAMVVIDDAGHVRAMVGGRDFSASQVNLALGLEGGGSGRQPGSAFKPIVLAEALDNGISMRSVFESSGTEVFPEANNGEDWSVSNYGGRGHDAIDLVDALRTSSNTAFAELAVELGPTEIQRMAARMGITAELPAVLSLALGAAEVSVMDMASAYSTLANRGERVEPILLVRVEKRVDGEWRVLDDFEPDRRSQVVDSNIADSVNYALSQVVANGTGAGAAIAAPAAGKTGTTQDNRDAWFVGFTCKLTAATWVGYAGSPGEPTRFMDNVRGQGPVTGGSLPATIWKTFMDQATVGLDSCPFEEPDSYPGRILNRDVVVTTTTTAVPWCNASAQGTTMTDASGNRVLCQMRPCGPNAVNGQMVIANGNQVPCQNRVCTAEAVNGRLTLDNGNTVPCSDALGGGQVLDPGQLPRVAGETQSPAESPGTTLSPARPTPTTSTPVLTTPVPTASTLPATTTTEAPVVQTPTTTATRDAVTTTVTTTPAPVTSAPVTPRTVPINRAPAASVDGQTGASAEQSSPNGD